MHLGNREWLDDLQRRYTAELAAGRLLEIGSLNMNGSAKEHLHAAEHIGVDRISGPDVDLHCDAVETSFELESFDILLSTSMMEHNPDWRQALTHNLQWLRRGGLLFLSWGAEGNLPHDPPPWAAVPVDDVLQWCAQAGVSVIDAVWEGDRYTADCPGCYDLVAVKP